LIRNPLATSHSPSRRRRTAAGGAFARCSIVAAEADPDDHEGWIVCVDRLPRPIRLAWTCGGCPFNRDSGCNSGFTKPIDFLVFDDYAWQLSMAVQV
jgi:hypothetical protein